MSMFQSNGPFNFGRSNPLDFSASEPANPAITRFFNSVYAWMAVGLALTAVVAFWTSQHVEVLQGLGRGIWALFIVEIVLVMAISSAINKINASVATVLFLLFAAIVGVTLSGIFIIYSLPSIAMTFLVTAGTFGAMSVWGMTTGRDLSRLGSILYMALIGLCIAMVVSFFYHPSMLVVGINFAGVVIFTLLTAVDTQRLRAIAYQTQGDTAMAARLSIVGSLMLYLDMINMFIFLLQFMGDRRR